VTGLDKNKKPITVLQEKTGTIVAHMPSQVKKWNDAALEQARPVNGQNQFYFWVAVETKPETDKKADKKADKE
jgi:hypothetical protein